MPGDLIGAGDERGAQIGLATAIADVPLTTRHDFERPVATLVELHRVHDWARFAEQFTAFSEHRDHQLLGLLGGAPGEFAVASLALFVGDPRCVGDEPTVASDDGPRGEVQLAPPRHVGGVAERADHGDAGSLLGVGEVMGEDRHLDPEQGSRCRGSAEQGLVAFVGRVRDQRDARREQLGAGGVDDDVGAVRPVERDLVVRAGDLAVLHFGLCDRRLVVDVPQRRRVLGVRLAAGEVVQEGQLADPATVLVDRGVQQRPVVRQPEAAQHALEDLLVLGDELFAQFDEVGPRDSDRLMVLRRFTVEWRLEVSHVSGGGIAADAEVVLDSAFGGETVVVPTDRVENGLAGHSLIAGDDVGVGVTEHVADVQ